MRKAIKKFMAWCAEDSAAARFERTVVQGIIGVVVGAVSYWFAGDGITAIVVAPVVMAVLSPAQSAIGNRGEIDKQQ